MDHVTDHTSAALARLITQYRDKLSIQQVVTLMTSGFQELEDTAFAMWSETVDTAQGAQLDVLGSIVGQARGGFDDPTYRLWIKTRIKINDCNSSPEEILAIFAALVGPGVSLVLQELFPAAFTLTVGYPSTLDPVQGSAILQQAKPAGVSATLITSTSDDANSFAFDPNGAGFGDTGNPATGGTLAGIV